MVSDIQIYIAFQSINLDAMFNSKLCQFVLAITMHTQKSTINIMALLLCGFEQRILATFTEAMEKINTEMSDNNTHILVLSLSGLGSNRLFFSQIRKKQQHRNMS